MTAWKSFSRGEYWYPTVTRTTWFLRYLCRLSPEADRGRLAAPLHLVREDGGVEVQDLHRGGTLPVCSEDRQCAVDHRALAGIAQPPARLAQRHPARVVDLVVVVGGVAGLEVAQEEVDRLGDPAAAAPVRVVDLTEPLADGRGDPGLLADLARGGLLRASRRRSGRPWAARARAGARAARSRSRRRRGRRRRRRTSRAQ